MAKALHVFVFLLITYILPLSSEEVFEGDESKEIEVRFIEEDDEIVNSEQSKEKVSEDSEENCLDFLETVKNSLAFLHEGKEKGIRNAVCLTLEKKLFKLGLWKDDKFGHCLHQLPNMASNYKRLKLFCRRLLPIHFQIKKSDFTAMTKKQVPESELLEERPSGEEILIDHSAQLLENRTESKSIESENKFNDKNLREKVDVSSDKDFSKQATFAFIESALNRIIEKIPSNADISYWLKNMDVPTTVTPTETESTEMNNSNEGNQSPDREGNNSNGKPNENMIHENRDLISNLMNFVQNTVFPKIRELYHFLHSDKDVANVLHRLKPFITMHFGEINEKNSLENISKWIQKLFCRLHTQLKSIISDTRQLDFGNILSNVFKNIYSKGWNLDNEQLLDHNTGFIENKMSELQSGLSKTMTDVETRNSDLIGTFVENHLSLIKDYILKPLLSQYNTEHRTHGHVERGDAKIFVNENDVVMMYLFKKNNAINSRDSESREEIFQNNLKLENHKEREFPIENENSFHIFDHNHDEDSNELEKYVQNVLLKILINIFNNFKKKDIGISHGDELFESQVISAHDIKNRKENNDNNFNVADENINKETVEIESNSVEKTDQEITYSETPKVDDVIKLHVNSPMFVDDDPVILYKKIPYEKKRERLFLPVKENNVKNKDDSAKKITENPLAHNEVPKDSLKNKLLIKNSEKVTSTDSSLKTTNEEETSSEISRMGTHRPSDKETGSEDDDDVSSLEKPMNIRSILEKTPMNLAAIANNKDYKESDFDDYSFV